MPNPFQMVRDWKQMKEFKAELLSAMRQTPVGAGLTIDRDLKNPIVARGIIELLKENPSFEMIDNGASITLMRKVAMHQSMSRDSYDSLSSSFQILNADGVIALGLTDQLPERKWRGGVPDDVNGTGPMTLDATKIIVEKP